VTDERDYDDIAEDLHAMRAEPRPEYARELDRRAASWLGERPRRRLASLRVAAPALGAAAAAVIVIALVASGDGGDGGGGGQLEVAVVAEGVPGGGATRGVPGAAPGGAAAPEGLQAPLAPEGESEQPDSAGGAFLLPEVERDAVTVHYLFPAPVQVTVALAGREAVVELEKGSGSIEVSTKGLPRGAHELTISAPSAPTFRAPVEIGG
jgi:hypothetical protein